LPPGLLKKVSLDSNSTSTNASTTVVNGETITICHYPPGNAYNNHTITIGTPAWPAHLAHGDVLGACSDGNEDNGDDDGDDGDNQNTAPEISSIEATSTTPTTAVVTWETNENATSTVWYDDSTPVDTDVASKVADDGLVTTSHSLGITGLTASTTYYYKVGSTDTEGGTSISEERSFETLGE